MGESLGSGVAVALGAGHRVGRIVLEGSFASAADVGAAHAYRFLPLRLLMKGADRRPSSVLVGALMVEPPLIPDRWNALLVGP